MTAAAEVLNVAQPALGLQIRNLEEELEVALLIRHSRGVQPTPAGEFLAKRAATILRSFDDLQKDLQSFVEVSRETIRFGITPSAMLLLGSNMILQAQDLMPKAFFSLVEELSFLLINALEAGELDAAFTYQRSNAPNLLHRAIMQEDVLLVTSPDIDPSCEPIRFEEAIRRDLVLAGQRDIIRQLVEEMAARKSKDVNVVYEAQSVAATRNLLTGGIASGIMPYGSIAAELESGLLRGRRIVDPPVTRTLYLVTQQRSVPIQSEAELTQFLESAIVLMTERLGDYCRPIDQ